MGVYRGYAEAVQRATEREHARRDGNYAKADSLRNELSAIGVRLDDSRHCFTTAAGHTGGYSLQEGVGFHEVQLMCLDREEARRDHDYEAADQIRDQLLEMGVTFDDKAHLFTMPDGVRGTYDLYRAQQEVASSWQPSWQSSFTGYGGQSNGCGSHTPKLTNYWPDREAAANEVVTREQQGWQIRQQGSLPPPPPLVAMGKGAGEGCRFTGYLEALRTALEREELRKNRDYEGSDRLRAVLNQQGAVLNDTTHLFNLHGLDGSYDLQTGITFREIQYVALEREEARRDRLYEQSDEIRQWLSEQDVRIDDRSHTFTMSDGTVGSYDLYKWTPEPVVWGGPNYKRQRYH